MSETSNTNPLWENSRLQFSRLISEMQGLGVFTNEVVSDLCGAMDLEDSDVYELLDWAETEWEKAKAGLKVIDSEDYDAQVLVSTSCSDDHVPIDFLRLTISPKVARKILAIQDMHNRQRTETDPKLNLANSILETYAEFEVECFDYHEEVSDRVSEERIVWGGIPVEGVEPVHAEVAKVRYDGDRVTLRAIPKCWNEYIITPSLIDFIRDIAEGRTPAEARV